MTADVVTNPMPDGGALPSFDDDEGFASDDVSAPGDAGTRVVRRWMVASRNQLRRVHSAAWLTFGASLTFAIVFGHLGVRHHNSFETWSFDMGIYDQAYWLVSRFDQTFLTVRGLEFWGHHVNLVAYLYAPFYWLGAGPSFLLVSQAAVIGLGGVPVYLIARDRFRSPWFGFCFAVVYLMYAPIQWITWANYHPEALVITPLLFGWWFAMRRSWRAYFVALLLALSTREDTALAVLVLGIVLLFVYRPKRKDWRLDERRLRDWRSRDWRYAWMTLLLGAAWYGLSTKVVIPRYNPSDSPWYVAAFFAEYGSTTGEVLRNIITHPGRVFDAATKSDRIRFYRDLFLPLGAVPLLGLPFLLMAAPQMLASVIGSSPYARQINYQYTAVMIAPIMIAAIEGFAVLWRRASLRHSVMGWMMACVFISNVAWSPSPLGDQQSVWGAPTPRDELLRAAVAAVPRDARVVASYTLLPHLAHREFIYDWPNPFVPAYWGNMNGLRTRMPDPGFIEYMALDRNHVSPEMQPIVDALIVPGGEFAVVFAAQNVLVATRIRAPAAPIRPASVPVRAPSVITTTSPALGALEANQRSAPEVGLRAISPAPAVINQRTAITISTLPAVSADPGPVRDVDLPATVPLE